MKIFAGYRYLSSSEVITWLTISWNIVSYKVLAAKHNIMASKVQNIYPV